jgi:uncharacterized SAM-binding protein YcdF (DUF218 family)
LFVAGLIRWQTTLSFLGRYLVYSQPPQSADIILVLAGDFLGHRVLKGAELGKQGYAPLVLISGGPYQSGMEGDYAISFLAKLGYSTRLFESFGHHALSTIQEAIALRGELRRRYVKRVILVTSDFHSRRSSIVFRLFCPGMISHRFLGQSLTFMRIDGGWMTSRGRSSTPSGAKSSARY